MRTLALATVLTGAAAAGVAHAQRSEERGTTASQPQQAPDPSRGPKRGYWFYEKPPPQAPDDGTRAPATSTAVLPPPPDEEALLKLHPTQVAKLIEEYRQNALFTMQPREVTWYYQLQDFARRRSRAFMNVTELVMLQNPQLNVNTEYPTNAPGSNARIARRDATIAQRLARERGSAALVMLASARCGFCEAQRGILKYFQQKHGWRVEEIDIDERPQAVARFGTSSTPTTFVIFRDGGGWMPVAVGVEALPKIEEGVYRAIRMLHGETTAEQFSMQEYEDGGLLDPTRR